MVEERGGGGGEVGERWGLKGNEMVLPKSLIAGSLKSNILVVGGKEFNRRGGLVCILDVVMIL